MMSLESMRELVENKGGHWEVYRISTETGLETVQIYIPRYLEAGN